MSPPGFRLCRASTRRRSPRALILRVVVTLPFLLAGRPAAAELWTAQIFFPFTNRTDAAQPATKLVRDAQGALYGAALSGGAHGNGRIFKLTPPAQGGAGWTEASLYDFPSAGVSSVNLLIGKQGTIYGTLNRTAYYPATIFQLLPPSAEREQWTFEVLHTFSANTGEENPSPLSNLIEDANGALYGTDAGLDIVFRLNPPAAGSTAWTLTRLRRLDWYVTGTGPAGGVVMDSSGALYGASTDGADGAGSVYKLTPPTGSQTAWQASALYRFGFGAGELGPAADLQLGPGGTLYAATPSGGTGSGGVVLQLSPPRVGKTTWAQSVLFNIPQPAELGYHGLVAGPDGTLFATTGTGGAAGAGAIYRLAPPPAGSAAWSHASVHAFAAASGGVGPAADVLVGPGGVLYGSTIGGGPFDAGTIFQLSPPAQGGAGWQAATLYSFSGGNDAGGIGSLTAAPNGELYATSATGGPNGNGLVVALGPTSTGTWQEEPAHAFAAGSDGAHPTAVIVDPVSGLLYGTTPGRTSQSCAGTSCGTIYRLTPPGRSHPAWGMDTLYSFTGTADGSTPGAGLVRGTTGDLFGTVTVGSHAAVFELSPPAPGGTHWTETTIYQAAAGVTMEPALAIDPAGHLYGTATTGSGSGFVFQLTPAAGGTAATFSRIFSFGNQSITSTATQGIAVGPTGALFVANQNGELFELTPPAAGKSTWSAQIVYSGGYEFTESEVIADQAGRVYLLDGSSLFELIEVPGAGWTANGLYNRPDGSYLTGLSVDKRGAVYTMLASGYGGPPALSTGLVKLTRLSSAVESRQPAGRPRQ